MKLDECKTFKSFIDFIVENQISLRVPDYQRPYAWDEKNIETLIHDLVYCDGNYFLGLFLLNTSEQEINVIDGQQRLTTIFILLNFIKKKFKLDNWKLSDGSYVSLSSLLDFQGSCRLFLQKDINKDYFFSLFNCSNISEIEGIQKSGYISEISLENAFKKIYLCVESLTDETCKKIIEKLFSSQIIVHSEANVGIAMRIFELMNDRGKVLSDLETVKSYSLSLAWDLNPLLDNQELIRNCFIDINRVLNEISEFDKNLKGDEILRYHVTAFCEWENQDYWYAKNQFKTLLWKKRKNFNELLSAVIDLKDSYKFILNILKDIFKFNVHYKWFKNVFIFGQLPNFYPLFLAINKRFKYNQKDRDEVFNVVCNYVEFFSFNAYLALGYRTDSAQNRFYRLARTIIRDELPKENIYNELEKIIENYCGQDEKIKEFENFLNRENFYGYRKGVKLRYPFIKYENYLVSESNSSEVSLYSDIDKIMGLCEDQELNSSIEHIVSQTDKIKDTENLKEYYKLFLLPEILELSSKGQFKEKDEIEAFPIKYFKDHYLHSIGNLVLAGKKGNRAKQNDLPEEKDWNGLESQHEIQKLINNARPKEHIKNIDIELRYDLNILRYRAEKIKNFIRGYWSIEKFDHFKNPEARKNFQERNPLI